MARLNFQTRVARRRLRPVVIVDDCPDALYLSARALRRAGLRNPLVTLLGGEAAIDYLRESCLAAGGRRLRRPQLVFLDIRMPVRDGFEVLRWVRRRKAFRKLPIVMLSTADDPTDLARATRLGAIGLLTKYPSATSLAQVLPPELRAWLAVPRTAESPVGERAAPKRGEGGGTSRPTPKNTRG